MLDTFQITDSLKKGGLLNCKLRQWFPPYRLPKKTIRQNLVCRLICSIWKRVWFGDSCSA